MSIFFCFGNPELVFSSCCQHLSYCIIGILFRINDMKAFKSSVIRCHCAIVQRNGFHPVFRHVLLGKSYSELFCPVVSEIEKDNYIAFFYKTDRFAIIISYYNRFHEFIGDTCIIRFMHTFNNISGRCTLTAYNQVISFLNPLPSLVAVHCIESSDE